MVSPDNQHCTSCIGTLSFRIRQLGNCGPAAERHFQDPADGGSLASLVVSLST